MLTLDKGAKFSQSRYVQIMNIIVT